MSTYPGVRDAIDHWLTFVEYLPDAGPQVPGYARRLNDLTGLLFDEPIVFLFATLAEGGAA